MLVIVVCKASLTPPTNVQDCLYSNQRIDGDIDDQEKYTCQCVDGHGLDSGNGNTTESVCQSGTWPILDGCSPGLLNILYVTSNFFLTC